MEAFVRRAEEREDANRARGGWLARAAVALVTRDDAGTEKYEQPHDLGPGLA